MTNAPEEFEAVPRATARLGRSWPFHPDEVRAQMKGQVSLADCHGGGTWGCMIDESSKRMVRLGLATEHPGPCPGCRTPTLTGATRRRIWNLKTAAAFRAPKEKKPHASIL
jgi:hypothetical protein